MVWYKVASHFCDRRSTINMQSISHNGNSCNTTSFEIFHSNNGCNTVYVTRWWLPNSDLWGRRWLHTNTDTDANLWHHTNTILWHHTKHPKYTFP